MCFTLLHHFPFGSQPGLSSFTRLEMFLPSRVQYINILPASHPKASLTNTCRNEQQSIVNKCSITLEESSGLHKKGLFPQHTMIIAIPFPKANSFSSGLHKYRLGYAQAQNCASFFPGLEINALKAISKSVSKDLNSKLGFPSPGSPQGERPLGKDPYSTKRFHLR